MEKEIGFFCSRALGGRPPEIVNRKTNPGTGGGESGRGWEFLGNSEKNRRGVGQGCGCS